MLFPDPRRQGPTRLQGRVAVASSLGGAHSDSGGAAEAGASWPKWGHSAAAQHGPGGGGPRPPQSPGP